MVIVAHRDSIDPRLIDKIQKVNMCLCIYYYYFYGFFLLSGSCVFAHLNCSEINRTRDLINLVASF